MLEKGDRVCVGVSGGADSMCLLKLLNDNRNELGITVCAAHVNHSIRGVESDRDEAFVKSFCEENGIPLYIGRFDIPMLSKQLGIGTELCARNKRYEYFNSLGFSKIATAHTGSDCIETMLMNLSRGASLHGLSSIPPVRDNIIRPLIYFTRENTERYCFDNGIKFVTDSTNLSEEYTRNRFRLGVLGKLKKINVSFEQNALRCISSLREDDDYLTEQAKLKLSNAYDEQSNSLYSDKLLSYHPSIAKRILALYFGKMLCSDYESKHINEFYKGLGHNVSVTLPSGIIVSEKNGIICEQKTEIRAVPEQVVIEPDESFDGVFGDYRIRIYYTDNCGEALTSDTYVIDGDKITDRVVIRSRLSGDSVTLAQRRCTKTVKKLFCEMKIPPEKRDSIPLFTHNGEIFYIPEAGASLKYAKTNKTKKFMIIKTEADKNDE